jgi:phosphatidate cytidylyltransferase
MTLPDSLMPNAGLALAGIVALLTLATLAVRVLARLGPVADHAELTLRVRSWWIMVATFGTALVLGGNLSLAFMALISFLALKEYLSLIPSRRADRTFLLWLYVAIPLQYYLIARGRYDLFVAFAALGMLLLLPIGMVMVGHTRNFLTAAATLYWGYMLCVVAFAHLGWLVVLPATGNPAGGGSGLVLYLVFLTEINDVTQYVFGRWLGRRKVTPRVSPGKTWEGLVGGLVTTAVLATVLAPWLTPLDRWQGLLAGLLIGAAGFMGDVTVSAVKRDLRVKDTGQILPGHGGVLDRIDSLIFTAPLFFHFVRMLHY